LRPWLRGELIENARQKPAREENYKRSNLEEKKLRREEA
jgi:hypothetical protein